MGVLPKLFKLWPWVDLDLFFVKVKFVGFCMGKSEIIIFWKLLQPLVSKLLEKAFNLTKWVYEVEWVSKVKVILWTWSNVTQISKLKLVLFFFQKIVGQFGTKIHNRVLGRIGMKIYMNELCLITNMAAMPTYGTNLKKSSFPEPIDRLPWNLVCSIMYGSSTIIV